MVSALVPSTSSSGASHSRGHDVCLWARHFISSHSRSPPRHCGGVSCDGLACHPGEVVILLAASCYKNWDKLRQLRAIGSKASHATLSKTEQKKSMWEVKTISRFLSMGHQILLSCGCNWHVKLWLRNAHYFFKEPHQLTKFTNFFIFLTYM